VSGWPDDGTSISADPVTALQAIIAEGRFGDTGSALEQLEPLIRRYAGDSDTELLLVGLWGKAVVLRHTDATADEVAAGCDLLEQAAQERTSPVWAAIARALRATVRLDAGDAAAALVDLARIDLDQLAADLPGPAGGRLLDALAMAYARLRLHDRVDDVRARLEDSIGSRPPHDRAVHWSHWASELAVRAMDPVASGSTEPDPALLQRAVEIAGRLSDLPSDAVPVRLRRGAVAVRALSAAYSRRATEALRLLGQDAFGQPRDLPALERQLSTLAAIQAHMVTGSNGAARTLDDGAGAPPASLPHLVLEICRARQRLWLETHSGGDVLPVMLRLNHLLVRLGWQGMDLVTETARQALEHQALRVESRTDALTGVGNRRALDEELRNMLRFSPMPLSLVLVDIDDFKRVNDRFTHVVGDEVLRRVAGALSELLRGGDRLVRYGGDEFVVLLPLTSDQEARAVAQQMSEAITRLSWDDVAQGLSVGITTGYAVLWSLSHRRPDGDAEQLFRMADEQLLAAKQRRGRAGATPVPAAGRGRRAAGQQSQSPPQGVAPAPAPAPRQDRAPIASAEPDQRPVQVPEPMPVATSANRVGAAELPLPFSPAGGLPLYRALLADPPPADPPPLDSHPLDSHPLDSHPLDPPSVEPHAGGVRTADVPATGRLRGRGHGLTARPAGRSEAPAPTAPVPARTMPGHGRRSHQADLDTDRLTDPLADDLDDGIFEPPPADPTPARPRRRPTVIDLTGRDDPRSPFG
jgi:diguanylate cyclase (GGDEF)-like protein